MSYRDLVAAHHNKQRPAKQSPKVVATGRRFSTPEKATAYLRDEGFLPVDGTRSTVWKKVWNKKCYTVNVVFSGGDTILTGQLR